MGGISKVVRNFRQSVEFAMSKFQEHKQPENVRVCKHYNIDIIKKLMLK